MRRPGAEQWAGPCGGMHAALQNRTDPADSARQHTVLIQATAPPLPHTLLPPAPMRALERAGEAVLRSLMERQPAEAPHIYCLPQMRMWTKLRPGVREFLARAHDLFELHIYTMGDRDYAAGARGSGVGRQGWRRRRSLRRRV